MRKIIYGIMGGVVLIFAGFALGLIVGAFIGGNYMTNFEFGGVRGYEAVGRIGAIIGVATGVLLNVLLWIKLKGEKIPRLLSTFIIVSFLIVALLITAFFLISDRPGEIVTLEQAQLAAGFTIYEPTYLPEGVKLNTIRWMNEGSEDFLYLGYDKDNSPVFDLIETKLMGSITGEDNNMVDISGYIGYIQKQMDDIYFTWHQGDTALTLSTQKLSEDELIKIARSVIKIE